MSKKTLKSNTLANQRANRVSRFQFKESLAQLKQIEKAVQNQTENKKIQYK